MEKLKAEIELKGLGMPIRVVLVRRTKRKAMYLRNDGYYEVFKIIVKPERIIFGKTYLEGEVYPGNDDFGFSAWCIKDKDAAYERYLSL
jgi:hypothetical protein